ncbi:response regulator [Cyanobacteria bacterium FACHB-63]|nr:response regulator [Cyanobacteria bacterium FACHB-63]
MNDDQISLHFQIIRQRISSFQQIDAEAWHGIDAALEDLQVSYEAMQSLLDVSEATNQDLRQQNKQLTTNCSHYRDLFHSSPIAYLETDANGVILDANLAIARLLNTPQSYVVGKPLAVFVAEHDLQTFYIKLNQLSSSSEMQYWQISLRPWKGKPFVAQLHVAIALHDAGLIEALRIGVYDLSQLQKTVDQPSLELNSEATQEEEKPMLQLPQSLDGLRVLVVDDEADIREFITAVLESHGISVRAVSSAAIALEELERFRPNVLLSDLRMPGGDGYSLIQRIRGLEAKQGGHLPAAAITAYLEEDREKSLQAGFEAYLHKLAQPIEWVELITQLAE